MSRKWTPVFHVDRAFDSGAGARTPVAAASFVSYCSKSS